MEVCPSGTLPTYSYILLEKVEVSTPVRQAFSYSKVLTWVLKLASYYATGT